MNRIWMLIVAYGDGRTEHLTFATQAEAHAEMERLQGRQDDHTKPATIVVTPVDDRTPSRAMSRYAAPSAV